MGLPSTTPSGHNRSFLWSKPGTNGGLKSMPIINVKIIENFFSEAQQKELVSKLTDAFCQATFEAARPYINVVIEEVKQGKWGLAGHPLPDAEFLVNDFVPIVEDAADAFVEVYGVKRWRPRGPAAPPLSERK
jgi:4-oxalocrotonate tautomerase family enzyme